MNFLAFVVFLSSCWAFVLLQKLCSEKPPNDRDAMSCCARLPNIVDVGTVEICIANYSKNSQRQLEEKNEMPKGNCVAECIANLTKIYRGNGIIDAANLARLFLNSVSGDREMGDLVGSAVNICLNETRAMATELRQVTNMKATFTGEIVCNPISGYVLGCVNTEVFKRCPNMTQSIECSALQNYSSSCHISTKYG